jgi:hypothetical protein
LKMRLRKNFSTKKIWPVSDLDPDPRFGSGFESGFESGSETGSETNFRPDPDPKWDPKLLFRIRNTALLPGWEMLLAPAVFV